MQNHSSDSSPEELLDVFKAAALSVTKLFKTSTAAQSKARVDGYQDCLEDLLAILDKGDVDVKTVRRWVLERLDGREPIMPTIESEDEVDKTDSAATPEPATHASGHAGRSTRSGDGHSHAGAAVHGSSAGHGHDTPMTTVTGTEMDTETETPSPVKSRTKPASALPSTCVAAAPAITPLTAATAATSTIATTTSTTTTTTTATSTPAATAAAAPPPPTTTKARTRARRAASPAAPMPMSTPTPEHGEPVEASAPITDGFTFRSTVPYPTESFLEIANLDLSDRRSVSVSASGKEPSESSMFASSPVAGQTAGPTFIFNSSAAAAAADATSSPSHGATARQFRVRHGGTRPNGRNILSARYNRSAAGQKRKLNFDEIFDVASLGYGKDVFSRGGGKRSRQV